MSTSVGKMVVPPPCNFLTCSHKLALTFSGREGVPIFKRSVLAMIGISPPARAGPMGEWPIGIRGFHGIIIPLRPHVTNV